MIKMTLSEKFALLVQNVNGDIGSLFGNEKQGLYVSALLELYCENIISGQKKVVVKAELPKDNCGVKIMYDHVCHKKDKSIASIMNSFMSPFNAKARKELKNQVLSSLEKNTNPKANLDTLVKSLQSFDESNIETIVIAKLLLELRLGKRYFDKEKRKELKQFLKNSDVFSDEIKGIMKVIESLATAGALAGAGVV